MSKACEGFNVQYAASASSKPLYRLYVQRAELFVPSSFRNLNRGLLARVLAGGRLLGTARRVTTLASTGRPGQLLGTLISQLPNFPGSSQRRLLSHLFCDSFGHSRASPVAMSGGGLLLDAKRACFPSRSRNFWISCGDFPAARAPRL